jgi:hypothetical protein
LTWLFVKMWFKIHRNVNNIRKQIIVFIKKHIIILFTHKSIHNSDRPHCIILNNCRLIQSKLFVCTTREVDQRGCLILCLFCRSYELICAWKGWLYVSLWKLLFVFLYYWHFGGFWTTFLQIIMSKLDQSAVVQNDTMWLYGVGRNNPLTLSTAGKIVPWTWI